jgi:peptidoglycan hydrolase-like protein with peptidoglycan-binding domain
MRGISVAVLLGLTLGASPVWAEDRALVIGNDPVNPTSSVAVASEVNRVSRGLGAAGFTVLDGSNLATDDLRTRLDKLLRAMSGNDTLVILLAGDFAHSAGQTWFVPPNAADLGEVNLASIGATSLNLATVLEVAGLVPGRALVLLGADGNRLPLGRGLAVGLGRLDIPQGVAVIRGATADLSRFALTDLPNRGKSLVQMLKENKTLTANGYLPQAIAFRAPQAALATEPKVAAPVNDDAAAIARKAEADDWAATQKAGTIAAYESFVQAYPNGTNLNAAQTELTRLRNDPTLLAQQAEDALNLSRDQRRSIQRQLTLLDFDTRGIDGILGRGSRAAITAWQRSLGGQGTGYLSRPELETLAAAADKRAAELEAEAAARQAQLDREDRSFWDRSGASGEEDGLRTYLRQYPDGLFAQAAKTRLAAYDLERQNQAAAQDRQAWAEAEQANSVQGYNSYLGQFPRGAFAEEAQARIAAANEAAQGGDQARAQAEAGEAALGLNPVTRKLIEQRLAGLGFDPGPADGAFDENTRRAIRRFQKARGQQVTGFIDQGSIVALLAGAVFKLGN